MQSVLAHRQIIVDWTRVEDFAVDEQELRSFEYHVVKDMDAQRVTLTIKCFDQEAKTVRLDPTIISDNDDVSAGEDPCIYSDLAGRRVRQLYCTGMI